MITYVVDMTILIIKNFLKLFLTFFFFFLYYEIVLRLEKINKDKINWKQKQKWW